MGMHKRSEQPYMRISRYRLRIARLLAFGLFNLLFSYIAPALPVYALILCAIEEKRIYDVMGPCCKALPWRDIFVLTA